MAEIVIIADDYTGANDTGVMIAQCGYRTCTVIDDKRLDAAKLKETPCIAYSTDSRCLQEREAYEAVYRAALRFGSVDTYLFSKRIDSTLRGNLGAECNAILDAAEKLQGGAERIAIICPAFPQAGRILIDDCLYVNGTPLWETAAAQDPKTPIRTKSVVRLFQKQLNRKIDTLHLTLLRSGKAVEQLCHMYEEGTRAVVVEARTEGDISALASAVLESDLPFVALDPGAFSQALAKELKRRELPANCGKLLFVAGSVNAVAAGQIRRLLEQPDVAGIPIRTEALIDSEMEACQEIRRAVAEVEQQRNKRTICLYSDGVIPERRIDLPSEAARRKKTVERLSVEINTRLCAVAVELLEDGSFGALFACGGDVAIELCRALGAAGEYPLQEVVPLAVYGRLADGHAAGMHIITKGGMVGDEDIMVVCQQFLYDRLEGI